ncbi:MAG: cyclic nucleotide-binding domain-containing protein [Alphaproteobacteria bacterium]
MLERLIATLTEDEAATLNPLLQARTYPRGAVIFEQFQEVDGFYFIPEGNVRLFQLTVLLKNLCALQLADLEADEYLPPVILGECSLLLDQLHTFTAVAATNVKAYLFPRTAYDNLKTTRPDLAFKLIEHMAQVLAFRYLNVQEQFQSRVIANTNNPTAAIHLLQKYVGNVKVCTPRMAAKLFRIDDSLLPGATAMRLEMGAEAA